jgi:arylsulfatase
VLAAFAVAPGSPSFAQQPQKPNIVVMLMDNLGYGELGVYGGAKECVCSNA